MWERGAKRHLLMVSQEGKG
jgi:hypothetical protein